MASLNRNFSPTLTKPGRPPRTCRIPKPESTPRITLAVATDGSAMSAEEPLEERKRSS